MISERLRFSTLADVDQAAGGLQRAFYPPWFRFAWHSHDFHEMAVILQGSGRHEQADGLAPIAAGDVIFIAPACRHRLAADAEALVFFNLACRPGVWQRHADALGDLPGWDGPDGSGIWRPAAEDRQWLTERFEHLEALQEPPDGLAVTALLLECAWRHRRACRRQRRLPALVRRVLAVLDDPTVLAGRPGDVADLVGCSREHLARLVRRHLGRSLVELLNMRRLDHAARLLRTGDLAVTEVALASGHRNLGHFYRCFRQRFGCAPGAYRRQHRVWPV